MLLLASTAHLGYECMDEWMDGVKQRKGLYKTGFKIWGGNIIKVRWLK